MDIEKGLLYTFAVTILLILIGVFDFTLAKIDSAVIPIIIILILLFISYDRRLKKIRKTNFIITVLASFFVIKPLNDIAIKIGSLIYPTLPLLGFALLFFTLTITLFDYLKYKKILDKTYYLAIIILLISFRDKTSTLGSLISDKFPFLGFILLVVFGILVFKDYKKYQKILSRTYLVGLIVVLLIFKDKIQPLKWGSDLILKIFPGAGTNAMIIFLILSLTLQLLLYYAIWKRKKQEEVFTL